MPDKETNNDYDICGGSICLEEFLRSVEVERITLTVSEEDMPSFLRATSANVEAHRVLHTGSVIRLHGGFLYFHPFGKTLVVMSCKSVMPSTARASNGWRLFGFSGVDGSVPGL